jgi:hypothetical protein
MKQTKIIINNFTESIKRSLVNTLNFENISLYEKYDYEEDKKKLGSLLNLCVTKNFVYDTVIPYLREHSPLEAMSENDRKIYFRNPMKLSYDRYGVIDYWWLILGINGYFNPYEFHDFMYLRIPSTNSVATIIDKELYNNKNYGIIPEND